MTGMDKNMKQEARVLLISAKVMQFCADIFAVFGIILFAYIYFTHWSSNPMAAIRDPFLIVTILFPFMPAAVMAFLAARKRQKVRALLEESGKAP